MKRNLSFVKAFVFLGLLLAVNHAFAQDRPPKQGDYRSTQDGSYGNPATWEQYTAKNGGEWRNCLTANIAPPGKLSVVTIKAGTTVLLDDGSNIPSYLDAMPYHGEGRTVAYPYEANKLFIENGASLISTVDHNNPAGSNQIEHPFDHTITTNSYDQGGFTLKVFGDSILNNGVLGGDGVDGIILEMPAPFTQGSTYNPAYGFRLTGSGSAMISKLRMVGGSFPAQYYAPGPDVVVYIEQDLILGGQGPAFTAVYKPTATDNYRLWIAPGVTVTLTNPLAEIHNQAVTSGNASPGGLYMYDIDGTLDASASTQVMGFTKLASATSVITVDVTAPGKLIVQHPLEKLSVANSLGDVKFLPLEGSGVIVPLDLLSFTAKVKEGVTNQVLLNWATANEVNTKEFYIQRSDDAKNFTTIGSLNTTNLNGTHNYSYVDQRPLIGTSYYILKQLDVDGKFKYSPVVSVNITARVNLVAYPNPTRGRLTMVYGELANAARIDIISANGKILKSIVPATGSTQTSIDVSGLEAGLYLVKFNNGSTKTTMKFIKN